MTSVSLALFIAVIAVVVRVVSLEAQWLWHHYSGRSGRGSFWAGTRERRKRALDSALHLSFLAIIFCACDAFFIEPTWLETTFHEIRSEKILPSTGKVRIVHLSDIHSQKSVLNEDRTAEIVSALAPDLIVITGDFVNEQGGLSVFARFMGRLKAPQGVYFVRGNYDMHEEGLEKLIAGLPGNHLENGFKDVEVRGSLVRVLGLDVGLGSHFRKLAARALPPGENHPFAVFLHHYAARIYEAERAGVELYLAGHTHGGQVRLPFYGALVTLAEFGKRFEGGRYRVGRTDLYVSRGIGMEGGAALRLRFLCRPEIAVFDLLPAPP